MCPTLNVPWLGRLPVEGDDPSSQSILYDHGASLSWSVNDAVASRRAGALEARSLLARAARALEMAKLEGKWVKEARE